VLEIGSSLRQARSDARLELTEIEAATMIPARYLMALENEEFERLPPGPYRRSFLREYAAFLGLDADAYVAEYVLRSAPPEPETPSPAPRRDFTRLLDALSPARAALVGLLALLGLAAWQLGGSSGPHSPRSNPATTTTRSRLPKTPAVPASRPVPVAARPSPGPPPALTLTATRGACWLSIHVGSSAGAIVYSRTLQPGEHLRFGLRKPLWIRLGAPWNLDATIGRRSVTSALPSRTGDLVATAAGVRPAT
jgi:hypothetical protein